MDHTPGAGEATEQETAPHPEHPVASEEAEHAAGHGQGRPDEDLESEQSTAGRFGLAGRPLRHGAFHFGFFAGLGAVLAVFLGTRIAAVSSTLILIVVAAFLAVGLNPLVEWLVRRGMRRGLAVLVVIVLVLLGITLFVFALVPVITDQITAITRNAPEWLDQLQSNSRIQQLNEEYQIIDKVKDYVANGDFASAAFGGVLGIGIAVLTALFNTFIIVVLTLYFLASLPQTKQALYQLAPASRRERVSRLGDEILGSIGSYVSGAFVVAMAAGISSLVFLFIVGLGEYAVALAFVVALLDVIPMIGATLGAIVVSAIGFATDVKIGIACVIFYVIYQQVENYLIYPRVMSRSVDIPGSVIVIAALVGAGLLGVVGALLAIPTAAAVLLLTREVFVRRQDVR